MLQVRVNLIKRERESHAVMPMTLENSLSFLINLLSYNLFLIFLVCNYFGFAK